MRLLTLATLSVSAVALSGCSFLGGVFGHGGDHHSTSQAHQSAGEYSYGNDDCCVGGKALSRWNLEGGLGADFVTGGEAFKAGGSHVGIPGQVLSSANMKDAYDTGYRASIGTSYALNPNRKFTGMINYNKNDGQSFNMGTQNGNALTGQFSDYESLGVEAGLRQYFQPRIVGKNVNYRPYVEGKLGAAKVNDIDLTFSEAGTAGETTTGFYDGGWVPTAGAMVGVETPIFKRGTLGLETGIRYSGALDSSNDVLTQAPQFGGTNNGSEKWSVPLTVRGRYRF